jgi:hypothetical protein
MPVDNQTSPMAILEFVEKHLVAPLV